MALIVVVRSYSGNSWIEGRRYAGDLSTAGYRSEQNDPVLIDFRTLIQEVDRADHVPGRPSRITLAHQKELPGEVEPRAGSLAVPRRCLRPLAVPRAFDDQHCGSRSRPHLAHVVQ